MTTSNLNALPIQNNNCFKEVVSDKFVFIQSSLLSHLIFESKSRPKENLLLLTKKLKPYSNLFNSHLHLIENAKRLSKLINLQKKSLYNFGITLKLVNGFEVLSFEAKLKAHLFDSSYSYSIKIPAAVLVSAPKQRKSEQWCLGLRNALQTYPPVVSKVSMIDKQLRQLEQECEGKDANFIKLVKNEICAAFGSNSQFESLSQKIADVFLNVRRKQEELAKLSNIEQISGLDSYEDCFRVARSMRRKFTLHIGPTNSGKTHGAFEALKNSTCGAYLAPLRLMALEGQEKVSQFDFCNMITGEERHIIDGAVYSSSTIEMANFKKELDVCIIDEGQIVTDPDRGWAWTASLVGIPAKTIYITGSADMIPYVKAVCDYLGEELEIVNFERKSKLEIDSKPVNLEDLKKNDALIVFSRQDALAYKHQLTELGKSCTVVYGNLDSEVRRANAEKFKSGEKDILIATDVISMGLNYPISRVVFSTASKFDGVATRKLNANECRQIGGRAGRFGLFESGIVSALNCDDLDHIRSEFSTPHETPSEIKLWVSPSLDHVQSIGEALKTEKLSVILAYFSQNLLKTHKLFKSCALVDSIEVSKRLDDFKNLSLEDKYTFSCAPVDLRSELVYDIFIGWCFEYANSSFAIHPPVIDDKFYSEAKSDKDLLEAESLVKAHIVYQWLHYRFENRFPMYDSCLESKKILTKYIENALEKKLVSKTCKICGTLLPVKYKHDLCLEHRRSESEPNLNVKSCKSQKVTYQPKKMLKRVA